MTHDPLLAEARAYWDGKRAGRAMPARRDIDPAEIPRLLPYVMLIDVLADPPDFRYRLIGTQARSLLRRDYTGQLFSELPGKGPDSVLWQGCAEAVAARAPVSRSPPYVGPERWLRDCGNILLPLSEDGARVDMILKIVSFTRGRPS